MSIRRIDISHHRLPLEPAFPAAWDPRPRRDFPVTIVRVHDDSGAVGIGSGDTMAGFEDYQSLFIGTDSLDLERHGAVLDNLCFHAGRYWPLEVALWDLAGKLQRQPLWRLLGGAGNQIRAYASSGMHHPPATMAALAEEVLARGFPALKIRLGRESLAEDLAAVAAVREAVGDKLALMVDCNQGWRMPWDTTLCWDLEQALAVARKLELFDIYWLEEPLHRGDYDGMTALRRRTGIPIAGGEMTREAHEFRELLARDCLDIFQPDAVCSLGIGGLTWFAQAVVEAEKRFTPHTWGNGIGLMANLHLTAGTVGAPFIEYPYDPPLWTADRRDFMLREPILADAEGWLRLGEQPGLGVELDEARLAATLTGGSSYE